MVVATLIRDARAIMLTSVAAATALIVGHDQFYSNLSGTDIKASFFSQQHNIVCGTAIAFFVKVALTVSIGTAYAQVLWHRLRNTRLSVAHIDSLASLTTSVALLDITLLGICPLLVALAAVSWCIPVATIFPPGTLTVMTITRTVNNYTQVPVLEWDSTAIFDQSYKYDDSDTIFVAPMAVANTISSYAASFGSIPAIVGALTNSSYDLSFWAPDIECKTTTQTVSGFPACSYTGARSMKPLLGYISWYERPTSTNDTEGGWGPILNATIPRVTTGSADGGIDCATITGQAIGRVSSFKDGIPNLRISVYQGATQDLHNSTWNVTTCTPRSSLYTVHFDFTNGEQRIDIAISEIKPWQPLPSNITGATRTGSQQIYAFNQLSMMALLGKITIGTVGTLASSTIVPNLFQSRMAFSDELQILNDSITVAYPLSGGPLVRTNETWSTNIQSNGGIFEGSTPTGSIASQLELFFRNMTVAITTSAAMAGVKEVDASLKVPMVVYTYNRQHLWVSYGAGLAITILIVAYGYVTVHRNGAPYSTKFSTYLRTMPWLEAESLTSVDSGADPLPRSIATAKLCLGTSDTTTLTSMPTRKHDRKYSRLAG